MKIGKIPMPQTSLLGASVGKGRTLGRPQGRIVNSKSSRQAMESTQPSSPQPSSLSGALR